MDEIKVKICLCNIKDCAKCLLSNCEDNNCLVHTIEHKRRFRLFYKNR